LFDFVLFEEESLFGPTLCSIYKYVPLFIRLIIETIYVT